MAGAIKRNNALFCMLCRVLYRLWTYAIQLHNATQPANERRSERTKKAVDTSCDNRLKCIPEHCSSFNVSTRIEFLQQIVYVIGCSPRNRPLCVLLLSSSIVFFASYEWRMFISAANGRWLYCCILVIPFSCILNELNSICGRLLVIFVGEQIKSFT